MDNLDVFVNLLKSGEIAFEGSEYIFSYDTENQKNFISLTMPVRKKSYVYNELHPIFEMHLPEGYLLSIIKKHFSKITKTDDFGLLKLMANSVSGRVEYALKEERNKQKNLTLEELISPKDSNLFEELVSRFALSSPLSGVQPKVLAKVENKGTLKIEDYIVKSWGEDYKELALNEYYCMKIVKKAGVRVPEFFISDDEKLFIMKRFDVKKDGTYLGFEDICVLLGKQRDDKYQGTYEQIAKTIQNYVSSKNKKQALTSFFKMIVINYLVQNGDGHLKNYGLLYDGVENIDLAPAYDVVCTTAYIGNDIPALNLLGSKKWWRKKFLLKFGIEFCLLTKKEAEECFEVCQKSCMETAREIEERLKIEKQKDKITILKKLLTTFFRPSTNK